MAGEVEFWGQDPATKAEGIAREPRTIIAPSSCGGSLGDRIHSWIGSR